MVTPVIPAPVVHLRLAWPSSEHSIIWDMMPDMMIDEIEWDPVYTAQPRGEQIDDMKDYGKMPQTCFRTMLING